MDDNVIPHLSCDIELNLSGPSDLVVSKWAADALRALADRLERGDLVDGHQPVTDSVGKPIGTVYIDYSGELA